MADRLRQLAQDGVARGVAKGIVDLLEVVDVDEKEADRPLVPCRPANLLLEEVIAPTAVREPRNRVRIGEPRQLAVRVMEFQFQSMPLGGLATSVFFLLKCQDQNL